MFRLAEKRGGVPHPAIDSRTLITAQVCPDKIQQQEEEHETES
jgi:hypothetical protein